MCIRDRGARVRRGTVPGRVDIGSPGDDERIEAAQEGLHDCRAGVAPRRQEHRDRSAGLELPDVPRGDEGGRHLGPHPVGRGLDIRRDTDDGR